MAIPHAGCRCRRAETRPGDPCRRLSLSRECLPGWLRLQGPSAFDPAAPCAKHLPLTSVDLGSLRLAVMDDATAEETQLNREQSPVYASDLDAMAKLAAPVWFVHHRPIWAAVNGPLGIPVGGNLQLIDATRIAAQAGG